MNACICQIQPLTSCQTMSDYDPLVSAVSETLHSQG